MFQTEDCNLGQMVKAAILYGKAIVFIFTFCFHKEIFTKQ